MEYLNEKIKKEIIILVEVALKPVGGKVKSFGSSYKMRHSSQMGNEPEKSWVETFYPLVIESIIGELHISISSLHMRSLWDAVEVACRDDIVLGIGVTQEIKDKIRDSLYSDEFMNLRNTNVS